MPSNRSIPLTIAVSYLSVLFGGPERTIFQINMPMVPREKYPEMDWRAADKVATWKLFTWCMKVIFMADQIPEERQYALILVAGGEEAYSCWDTLEDTVENVKDPEQVWDAFEKSFEQSTSFWHFRDTYLADFRQDPRITSRPGSPHQADCQGMPMEEGI